MEVMAMIPPGSCAWDDESFEQYSMGKLPETEAAALEEHLLVCELCQARLAREDALRGHIRRAAELHRARERNRGVRLFPSLVPAIAAIAALLLVGVVAMRWIRPGASAPAFALRLEAMRGAEPGGKAPADRPLAIDTDLAGLPAAAAYRLELVDREGGVVWKGPAPHANLPALRTGTYFMRVYGDGGRLLREYGLEIQGRH